MQAGPREHPTTEPGAKIQRDILESFHGVCAAENRLDSQADAVISIPER